VPLANVSRDMVQGKQGPVVHLSKQMLFIQSRDVKQNGGFICVAARNCKVFGGDKTDPFAVSLFVLLVLFYAFTFVCLDFAYLRKVRY
jgi:hypothetical protein